LTLLEMLVAMVVGLFLMGGLLTVEQSVHEAFDNQARLTQLQDNERLAMSLMTDTIQSAGYFPDPTTYTSTTAFPAATPFASAQVIAGTHNSSAPGDTVTVRYVTSGSDNVVDCTGKVTTAQTTLVNAFKIVNQSGQNYLVCTMNGTDINLVPGVQNLQIVYGLKTNGVDNGSIDRYMPADAVTTGGYWGSVISVKVSLTFANPLAGQSGQPASFDVMRVISVMGKTGVKT
jgi:type IV pilus assembly protein PilW